MTCYLIFEDIALGLSVHAYKRRTQRGIQQQHIAHLLRFGRKQFHRHAIYYSIGHKEINKYADICPMLKNMNGMHLVTATNGKVLTMFRDDLLDGAPKCPGCGKPLDFEVTEE